MLQNLYEDYTEVAPSTFVYRILKKGGNARVEFQKINCDDTEIICRRTLVSPGGRHRGFIKLCVHSDTHKIKYEVYSVEGIKSCYKVDLSKSDDIYKDLIKRIL